MSRQNAGQAGLHTRALSRREFLRAGAATAVAAAGFEAGAAAQAPPPFGLGLVTYNVARDWELDTVLRICREVGLKAVEFRTTHRHGVEPTLGQLARADVRQKCRDAGLEQISLGTTCEFQSPDPAIVRTNIRQCVHFAALARDIGALGVKVRPNGLPGGVPADQTIAQIGRALIECGRRSAEFGVEVWMEVHGPETQVPSTARRIMDACGHRNVGVTWNSNPTDVVNGSIGASFELLRPFIRSVHINDLWSGYPYAELFALLRSSGFDRFTLCEYGDAVDAAQGAAFLRRYKDRWEALVRPRQAAVVRR
jgi:sugar phosphate isomerase/epimerase